jgi:hypothetical protein
VEIETISKPNQDYRTEEYAKLGLPLAPAICRHLGLPEPEPQKKGILDRLFK